MAQTDAQRAAVNRWQAAHMTVLSCKLRKEDAEAFRAACKAAGTSPNAVFRAAIAQFMAAQDARTDASAPQGAGADGGRELDNCQHSEDAP